MPNVTNPFRGLPSVNQLLESPPLKSLVNTANHSVVVGGVRTFLDRLRDQIQSATEDVHIPSPQELAEKIAAKSPKAVRLAKESLNGIELLDVKKSYRFEQGFTLELYTSPDSQEARDAFVEKRDADFEGKR